MINILTPFDTSPNIDLGFAYNKAISNYDNDEDWIVLKDGDVMFLTSDFGNILQEAADIAEEFGQPALLTCWTNRINQLAKAQRHEEGFGETDILKQIDIAESFRDKEHDFKLDIIDNDIPISGMLMMFKVKTWKSVGGFKEGVGALGVDNDFTNRLRGEGVTMLRINRLYVFHVYRLKQGIGNKDHLQVKTNSGTPTFPNHTEILNYLIERYKLKSYLEIGVADGKNFNAIKIENKLGVDPNPNNESVFKATSDIFFDSFKNRPFGVCYMKVDSLKGDCNIEYIPFDLIFIDWLHTYEQVKRDFENALKCLTPNGFCVIHDTNPLEESWTCVPRGNQKVWTGDVYKFACKLNHYDNIDFCTYPQDFGVTIVWKSDGKKAQFPAQPKTFSEFMINKNELLRIGKGLREW